MTVDVRLAGTFDPGAPPDGAEGPAPLKCALVNNMPDAAFCATERQFVGLLDAGFGCDTVAVTRHTMAGVPRGEQLQARIAAEYRPLGDITSDPPDLLVVTGSNPIESRIEDERYWSDLCGLLWWGSQNVPVMVLSCLSAHAALAVFDGVERTTLSAKCTGVFAQEVDPTHPLAAGMPEIGTVVLPHSRLNAVPVEAVAAAGYAVALQSKAVGWSVVTKTVGRSNVVLVQAHPEYDPSSLVREYVRDMRRYVGHERDELPCLPRDCVAGPDWHRLRRLHERVLGGERNPALVAAFPFDEVSARAPWPWRGPALRLYANLLGTIPKRRST
jgi:homoserine O-succinyltransferase